MQKWLNRNSYSLPCNLGIVTFQMYGTIRREAQGVAFPLFSSEYPADAIVIKQLLGTL